MKLTLALLSVAAAKKTAARHRQSRTLVPPAPVSSLAATSPIGASVLSQARRLDDADDAEADYTWVAGMSLKFQGCYHTQSWNGEADGDEDIKISTQRLVRFRLCPTASCAMEDAGGCGSGYGDYIIGMEQYLEAYFEAIEQDQQYSCEYEKDYGDCACEDGGDDNFDEEICEYDCYMSKGMEYCVDGNPYNDDEEEEEEEMELREMAECRELEVEDDDNNRRRVRRLDGEEEEVQYFVGAYCSDSGASIHLGVFTEETCSQFADDYGGRATYEQLTSGKSLPYAESTMIGTECLSCKEPADGNGNDGDDGEQDADEVKESCEQLYEGAGKCESELSGYVQYPNNNGCNYMEGIKIVRKNGVIVRGAGSKNGTASVFIGVFAASFVLLGGYAYFLKTKLDRAKVNLVE